MTESTTVAPETVAAEAAAPVAPTPAVAEMPPALDQMKEAIAPTVLPLARREARYIGGEMVKETVGYYTSHLKAALGTDPQQRSV